MKEAEWYARYADAIESRYPGRWISKAVVQAFPKEEVKLLKSGGYRIYHPNYEIWDEKLFEWICPGKTRYVGRNEWMKRIVDAADVFGPEHVIPNFVGGVEMAQPYGYTEIDSAIASTAEGLDFFMSKGIIPRFTTWCPEPTSDLGRQEGPPLEYFVKLLYTWRSIFEEYKLPAPPGYGKPGVGNAEFSVSAFMDVIRVEKLPEGRERAEV